MRKIQLALSLLLLFYSLQSLKGQEQLTHIQELQLTGWSQLYVSGDELRNVTVDRNGKVLITRINDLQLDTLVYDETAVLFSEYKFGVSDDFIAIAYSDLAIVYNLHTLEKVKIENDIDIYSQSNGFFPPKIIDEFYVSTAYAGLTEFKLIRLEDNKVFNLEHNVIDVLNDTYALHRNEDDDGKYYVIYDFINNVEIKKIYVDLFKYEKNELDFYFVQSDKLMIYHIGENTFGNISDYSDEFNFKYLNNNFFYNTQDSDGNIITCITESNSEDIDTFYNDQINTRFYELQHFKDKIYAYTANSGTYRINLETREAESIFLIGRNTQYENDLYFTRFDKLYKYDIEANRTDSINIILDYDNVAYRDIVLFQDQIIINYGKSVSVDLDGLAGLESYLLFEPVNKGAQLSNYVFAAGDYPYFWRNYELYHFKDNQFSLISDSIDRISGLSHPSTFEEKLYANYYQNGEVGIVEISGDVIKKFTNQGTEFVVNVDSSRIIFSNPYDEDENKIYFKSEGEDSLQNLIIDNEMGLMPFSTANYFFLGKWYNELYSFNPQTLGIETMEPPENFIYEVQNINDKLLYYDRVNIVFFDNGTEQQFLTNSSETIIHPPVQLCENFSLFVTKEELGEEQLWLTNGTLEGTHVIYESNNLIFTPSSIFLNHSDGSYIYFSFYSNDNEIVHFQLSCDTGEIEIEDLPGNITVAERISLDTSVLALVYNVDNFHTSIMNITNKEQMFEIHRLKDFSPNSGFYSDENSNRINFIRLSENQAISVLDIPQYGKELFNICSSGEITNIFDLNPGPFNSVQPFLELTFYQDYLYFVAVNDKDGGQFYRVPVQELLKENLTSFNEVEIMEEENSIKLYPNPAKESLFLKWSDSLSFNSLEIIDITGALIKRMDLLDYSYECYINIDFLNDGIYTVRFVNDFNGAVVSKKFIKAK